MKSETLPLFTKVASLLGGTIKEVFPNPDNEVYNLVLPQFTLSVQCNGYRMEGKASISYLRPRDSKGQWVEVWKNNVRQHDPSIKLSLSKSPEQIAKDIKNRLWSDTFILDELVKEKIAQDNKFLDEKAELLKEVATILRNEPERNYQSKELTGEVQFLNGLTKFGKFGYGTIQVNSGDSISINIHSMGKVFGLDVVKAIAEVVKTYSKKNTQN
jgi:hypothetical protein